VPRLGTSRYIIYFPYFLSGMMYGVIFQLLISFWLFSLIW